MTLPLSSRRSSAGWRSKFDGVMPVLVTRFSKSMKSAMRRSVGEFTNAPIAPISGAALINPVGLDPPRAGRLDGAVHQLVVLSDPAQLARDVAQPLRLHHRLE